MPATFATDGAINIAQGGLDGGGGSTCIGVGSNNSGVSPPGNFTSNPAQDVLAWHIGGGTNVPPASTSNTGQILNPEVAFTAGAGAGLGTYRLASNASGGQPAGAAEIEFTTAAGAVTSVRVVRPGSGFTSAPTFTVANAVNVQAGGPVIGASTATFTAAVGLLSQVYALGTGFGAQKNLQRLTATGNVAIDAAVTPSTYLNRSGRALVAGDSLFAVEP